MRSRPLLLAAILAAAPLVFSQTQPDWETIRNPRALRETHRMNSLAELRSNFTSPPAEFRSAPLWVWNDEMDEQRIRSQLQQFARQGIGNVFIHPRPGLMTDYLSPKWFHLWRVALEEGKKLGLLVHIYDENSYPAGFAGGHVVSQAPDTAARVLGFEIRKSPKNLPWQDPFTVAIYAARLNTSGTILSARRIESGGGFKPGEAVVVMTLRPIQARAWTAGFPYVDLTNPRTTEVFLKTTYEAYRRQFGEEFGRSIRWAFSDEPQLAGGAATVPLSFRALTEFRRRHDYDLADHLPELFWDVGNFRKVRFDYWQLMHDLLRQAFFGQMFSWCDRHHLQWTGHWMEHEWPYPRSTPAEMSFYAFEHIPGIDMLGFQTWDLGSTGAQPHMLFTIKQAASVAHQLGRPRVLSESYGGGGWGSTIETFKRVGDWELVHGINLIDQHLAYTTIRGARKRDWPQSFSDVSAWWPYYRIHADHIGRVSLALTAGRARSRVLVLEPTTSAWLEVNRVVPGGKIAALERIRQDYDALVQFLADHQVDYDLGDEYMLEWFGGSRGRRLLVGEQAYDVVIWPKDMTNLRRQTLPLLERFLSNGGKVVALSGPASYVDGRASKTAASLRNTNWIPVRSYQEMLQVIRKLAPPRIRLTGAVPGGIGFAERFLNGGERVLFLNNAGPATVDTGAIVEGASIEQWDTITGKIRSYPADRTVDGELRFRVHLPPAGSLLLAVSTRREPLVKAPAPAVAHPLPQPEWRIAPDSPNVLVLDYCDVEVGGKKERGVLAVKAARDIFRAHGFARDPWNRSVQFRRTIFERNHFPDDSGFTATYHFRVADAAALRDLQLAVESSELYQVRLNGKPVDFSSGTRWLDPHLRRASIEKAARPGDNVVEIRGRPFDVRMELDNIYVLGRFGLRSADTGFELVQAEPLHFGSWARQGRPFYSESVLYRGEVNIADGARKLRIELGRWHGSVAQILVDGKPAAVIAWQPWRADVAVSSGRHEIAVRVVGTPQNLFGAFHDPREKGKRIPFPGTWTMFADLPEPAGSAYQVEDYGLLEAPKLSLLSEPAAAHK